MGGVAASRHNDDSAKDRELARHAAKRVPKSARLALNLTAAANPDLQMFNQLGAQSDPQPMRVGGGDELLDLDMTIEEAMKLVVSGGIVGPANLGERLRGRSDRG